MNLQLSQETNNIYENDKPDLGGSGLLGGPVRTELFADDSILPRSPNFDKGRGVSHGFKAFPHSFLNSHVWKGAKLKYRAFITELLSRSVWKNQVFMAQGNPIDLVPGQYAASIRGIIEIFNPVGLRGKARSDCFSKNDVEGAIQYFSNHRIIRQEIRHQMTVLTFIDKDIYDLNFCTNQTGNQTEIRQKSDSHLNLPDNQITKDIRSKDPLAQTAKARLRKSDSLKYSFESGAFEGMTEKDLEDWSVAYPAIKIQQQIASAVQWIKSNPTKVSGKKLWRKFLTGWFSRSNDKAVNQEAYSKNSGKIPVDRRQKNSDGSLANGGEDLF